mmetsp:Transcript_2109/g.7640  ORF Transcript_2109/g.7640 Transcript_2109/m.7640 type:complete len:105 (+) Transcript_2109:575-889(+)
MDTIVLRFFVIQMLIYGVPITKFRQRGKTCCLACWIGGKDKQIDSQISANLHAVLCSLSTSAGIEQTWSGGRDIVDHRRFQLKPDTISHLLFLKSNKIHTRCGI